MIIRCEFVFAKAYLLMFVSTFISLWTINQIVNTTKEKHKELWTWRWECCPWVVLCSSIVKKIQVVQWIRIMIQVKCNPFSFCGIATQNTIRLIEIINFSISAKRSNEYNSVWRCQTIKYFLKSRKIYSFYQVK